MSGRKILSQIITGSNLYGTNGPDSDIDYCGVFMPSKADLLSLSNCPTEMTENVKKSAGPRNAAGDVDCKFFTITKFLRLLAEGQPGQLEMLFAPPSHTLVTSTEWKTIKQNERFFLSKRGVEPFIGFAIAQAHKATIRGENLNALRAIESWGDKLTPHQRNLPLADHLHFVGVEADAVTVPVVREGQVTLRGAAPLTLDMTRNDKGYTTLRTAGRQFDPGTKTKTFLSAVSGLISKYGARSDAAARNGLDYKSLMHAYRLLFEAEEFLKTGFITLPRPVGEIEILKAIRAGDMYASDFDWHSDLLEWADRLHTKTAPESCLPDTPNWSKINSLCEQLLWDHLSKSERLSTRIWKFFSQIDWRGYVVRKEQNQQEVDV